MTESKYLIIGTHPPMHYCGKLEYYYGNMSEFFRFLDKVYPGNKLYQNGCPNINDIIIFQRNTKYQSPTWYIKLILKSLAQIMTWVN